MKIEYYSSTPFFILANMIVGFMLSILFKSWIPLPITIVYLVIAILIKHKKLWRL